VCSASGELWMVDRHHRLRALLELDPEATAFGYVVLQLPVSERTAVLEALHQRGWLYLYDGRGHGPHAPMALPRSLADTQDDPYRSLVWKLKREGVIAAAPLIPFHEFRWGAWLRSRNLPPFCSERPGRPRPGPLQRRSASRRLGGPSQLTAILELQRPLHQLPLGGVVDGLRLLGAAADAGHAELAEFREAAQQVEDAAA